jgi:hypothetical protein
MGAAAELQSPPTKPAPAAFLDSANGYRQGSTLTLRPVIKRMRLTKIFYIEEAT